MKTYFKNILDQLLSLSESARVKLTLMISFFFIIGLFSLWVKETGSKFATLDINKPMQPDRIEIAKLLNNAKSGIANIASILQESFSKLFIPKRAPKKEDDKSSSQDFPFPEKQLQNPSFIPQLPLSD